MWAVENVHTDEITLEFYDDLIDKSGRPDCNQAVLVLHKTTRSLFSSDVPFDQWIVAYWCLVDQLYGAYVLFCVRCYSN